MTFGSTRLPRPASEFGATANAMTVDPNGTDVIWLNGTAASAGEAIVSSGAAGEIVTLVSDGTVWRTWSVTGTWAEAVP